MYIHIYIYIYTHTYIYRERERCSYVVMYSFVYLCNYMIIAQFCIAAPRERPRDGERVLDVSSVETAYYYELSTLQIKYSIYRAEHEQRHVLASRRFGVAWPQTPHRHQRERGGEEGEIKKLCSKTC